MTKKYIVWLTVVLFSISILLCHNSPDAENTYYIAHKNTKKFHYTYCCSARKMKEENKEYLSCSRDTAISIGFSPCKNCTP